MEDELNLVSVHQVILALVILEHNTDAVSIGVTGERNVGLRFFGLLDSHQHGTASLGVGLLNSGEVTTHHILLGHVDNVVKAPAHDGTGDDVTTHAMDGRVDNLQVVVFLVNIGAERERMNLLDILGINIFANNLDKVGVALKLDFAHVGNGVHVLDDVHIVR